MVLVLGAVLVSVPVALLVVALIERRRTRS
jgi:hypothetical protein